MASKEQEKLAAVALAAAIALQPIPALASPLDDAAVYGQVLSLVSFRELLVTVHISIVQVKVADSTYPILQKLQKKDVVPVVSKAIGAALSGDPVSVLKVAKAADEALISTDPAKLVGALKAVDVALVRIKPQAEGRSTCQ